MLKYSNNHESVCVCHIGSIKLLTPNPLARTHHMIVIRVQGRLGNMVFVYTQEEMTDFKTKTWKKQISLNCSKKIHCSKNKQKQPITRKDSKKDEGTSKEEISWPETVSTSQI